MMQQCLISLVLCSFALMILVHAQNQSDFISIDCGLQADFPYPDAITGIIYTSDETFTENGVNKNISLSGDDISSLEDQYLDVRSFPDGIRNCYTLRPAKGKGEKYLIRASFMYGNYDEQAILPEFDLYLGVNKWDKIKFENYSDIVIKEIIHTLSSDYIDVCLVNYGSGVPFILALELRHMKNSIYEAQLNKSLVLYRRWDVGSTSKQIIRYYNDIYDRIWYPFKFNDTKQSSPLVNVSNRNTNDFQPPSVVMNTVTTPRNSNKSLKFSWEPDDRDDEFYVYLHFAELENLTNDVREFNILRNGNLWYGPLNPQYLYAIVVYSITPISGSSRVEFSLEKTANSTLPPIINAVEIYKEKDLQESQTDEQNVDAMMNIKATYRVTRNWQGDPCVPKDYLWEGLDCSYNGSNLPQIISLNLSSRGLTGVIDQNISNLVSIQYLDLSNNNLTGPVPDFLTRLQFLSVLNLKGNKLNGSVPVQLVERANNRSLTLSVDEYLTVCLPGSCENNDMNNKKSNKKMIIISVVASVAAFVILLVILFGILWKFKRQNQQVRKEDTTPTNVDVSVESSSRVFTYSEVLRMTDNFERILGKGGFGTVYHGNLDDTQVAVKMLASSSVLGYKEFETEAKILMKVRHKNLTTLVGYCKEDTNKGLVCEFMANGALETHLSGKNVSILSWEDRLRIALDAAQGLKYLHSCIPPIIHKDLKSTNILLNETFEAKLSDFGLSRVFPVEGDTHVSTVVVGTPGYLDPEYFVTNWLNEKSDVYSFGVVLLEIVTSRPVITRTEEKTHIIEAVSSMLENGDMKSIADPRLVGEFDNNSIWKAVEIAMACVHTAPSTRPTMTSVVMGLKDCLALELARTMQDPRIELTSIAS